MDYRSACSVPATGRSPAYIDISTDTHRFCEKDAWICLVDRAGRERPHITFDPAGKQWMCVLAEGAYGIMRSPGQTWTKTSGDEFSFVNEELARKSS
jgi:hypothetical protein